MKLQTLLIAVGCVGTLLSTSCSPSMQENQLKYTHTSLVDGDAYQFFQIVGEKIPYEIDYATYVENSNLASAEVKQLAGKLKGVFTDIVPNLDSLATTNQVDFPIRGALQFTSSESTHGHGVVSGHDSTTVATASDSFSDEAYKEHLQHELATLKTQFKRASRNTNKKLRDYAASQLESLSELYKLAGGKEEAGGHH